MDALSRLPGATIYLEAGASDWEPARRTAKKLRKIGISKVRGFMLNVTHYDWTAANIRHGIDLSRRLGGKHFVINTSQNGRGPVHYKAANGRRINIWCNPGMRGLGPAPTTATSHPLVDAYLWINRPGLRPVLPGPQDRLVPAASAHARALRHGLGEPAAGHPLRALQALSAERVRRALSSGTCAGTSARSITSSRPRPRTRCAPTPPPVRAQDQRLHEASQANEEAFERAIDEVADASARLLDSLVTSAPPKDREVEAEKRKARSAAALRGGLASARQALVAAGGRAPASRSSTYSISRSADCSTVSVSVSSVSSGEVGSS